MKTLSMELRDAANRGDVDNILHWLRIGAKVDSGDADGWTALHLAIHAGYPIAAMKLVEQGANVNVVTKGGDTPLHWSSFNGQYHVSLALIEKGANPNARNQFGATPLHAASRYGRHEVVTLLIQKGANVHIKTKKERQTPLHIASLHNFKDVVETLLAKGADCRVVSFDGTTALDLAMDKGHWSIAVVLRDAEEKTLITEREQLFQQNDEFGKKWTQLTHRMTDLQHHIIGIEKKLRIEAGGASKTNEDYEAILKEHVERQETLKKQLSNLKTENVEREREAEELGQRLKALELESNEKEIKIREDLEGQISRLHWRMKSLERRVPRREDKPSTEGTVQYSTKKKAKTPKKGMGSSTSIAENQTSELNVLTNTTNLSAMPNFEHPSSEWIDVSRIEKEEKESLCSFDSSLSTKENEFADRDFNNPYTLLNNSTRDLESSMSNDELLNSGEWKQGKSRKNRKNRRR